LRTPALSHRPFRARPRCGARIAARPERQGQRRRQRQTPRTPRGATPRGGSPLGQPSCLYTPHRQFSQLAWERAAAPPVFAPALKPNLIRAWLTPRRMTNSAASGAGTSLREQVKTAVLWRSGGQIAAQVVAWSSTLMVIRILDPADYG